MAERIFLPENGNGGGVDAGTIALASLIGNGDPDGYDGLPFTRWYADMRAKGIPIDWEAM